MDSTQPPSDESPPLVLDQYITIVVARRSGELPKDDTVRELLREVGIGRTEEEWMERGAPEVLYSGFMWEPHRIDDDLSDECLTALGLACVLRAKHQLRYWQPMLEMGREGRFRGHLAALEETRDILRAIAKKLIDRPELMKKVPRLQPRLAKVLVEVLKALPQPVEEWRDREVLIPQVLSEEEVPTGDDEDVYVRDTLEDDEEEPAASPEYESATAPPDEKPTELPPLPEQGGGKGLWIGVMVALVLAAVAVLLIWKFVL